LLEDLATLALVRGGLSKRIIGGQILFDNHQALSRLEKLNLSFSASLALFRIVLLRDRASNRSINKQRVVLLTRRLVEIATTTAPVQ
jgi:hypothetical protein